MTDLEALAKIEARNGEPFELARWLISDSNPDAALREGFKRALVEMATANPRAAGSPPDTAESLALLARAKACPYRSTGPGCGCSGARCGLRPPGVAGVVSHVDCFACVRRYDRTEGGT